MSKLKILNRRIVNYLRELSIVVIGILITVGIGFRVNIYYSKKDLERHISAIKLELEQNVKNLDQYIEWLGKSYRYTEYLKSNDKKNLNRDSLFFYSVSTSVFDQVTEKHYGCGIFMTNSFSTIFTTNALDMFKYSGTIRQLKNDNLLLSIWNSYRKIEEFKNFLDKVVAEKAEDVKKELPLLMTEGKFSAVPMNNFYSSEYPITMIAWSMGTSETLKETLSKLEEAKIVK